jgi:serine protease Do
MLESSRYSWHRGQLRAEYELSGEQLERVSWEGLSQVSKTVARRVSPSVVHIQVASNNEEAESLNRWNPDMKPFRIPSGQGSGIVVREDGFILTNHHVLDGNTEVLVYMPDDRVLPAEVVGVDRTTDLALLKINAKDLLPIAWGDSDEVEIGSPVWAVGSPFGLTGSVSFGILSGKHRIDLNANPQYRGSRERITSRYSDLMQSDVAVNPGNSGGPLVNGRGELIGINTAIVGESYRGVSFSIPSRIAREVLDQFIAHGRVRRGWMGVELATEIVPEDAQIAPRAVVRSVVPDSPAERAGIYPGDRILEYNDKPVKNVEQLIDTIRTTPADSTVRLTLDREGNKIAIEVRLGELSFAP